MPLLQHYSNLAWIGVLLFTYIASQIDPQGPFITLGVTSNVPKEAELSESDENKRPGSAITSVTEILPEKLPPAPVWASRIKFMLIGCTKCGTTYTYLRLTEHPRVLKGMKETHCFDDSWAATDPYCQRFHNRAGFAGGNDTLISGDYSPSYMFNTEVALPRINTIYPSIQIMASLRSPVDRAFSHYQMRLRAVQRSDRKSFRMVVLLDLNRLLQQGMLPYWRVTTAYSSPRWKDWEDAEFDRKAFKEFFNNTDKLFSAWHNYQRAFTRRRPPLCSVGRGLYAVQLRRWMTEFPKERFLVWKTEDMMKGEWHEQQIMNRIQDHLNLPFSVKANTKISANKSDSWKNVTKDDQVAMDFLKRFFKPHNEQLDELLGDDWSWTTW